jgi:catechol O-methyltransferase
LLSRLLEAGGRRAPFLRWSAIRMILGARHLRADWQVGDGREEALAAYVADKARRGDAAEAIRVIDEFCYHRSIMMNVGDEKGAILDAAVRRAEPALVIELGTYCGYSALRMSQQLPPGGRVISVEYAAANAAIARRILEHAGVADRVTVVEGHLGDGGATAAALEADHGVGAGSVDAVFLDHAKDFYLPDLMLMVERGWLHPGSVVVADNVRWPGAPEYKAFMQEQQGGLWHTVEHETHVEYQTLLKDLVLVSEYRP